MRGHVSDLRNDQFVQRIPLWLRHVDQDRHCVEQCGFHWVAISGVLKAKQEAGYSVLHIGKYHGQYQFLGRLDQPLVALDSKEAVGAYVADHEKVALITNLRGEAEVALSRARSEEEYRHIIESSIEEYERLSRMVGDILFLARPEGVLPLDTRKGYPHKNHLSPQHDRNVIFWPCSCKAASCNMCHPTAHPEAGKLL